MGNGTAVSKTGADLLGNRKFESTSLQRRVFCEPDVLKLRWITAASGSKQQLEELAAILERQQHAIARDEPMRPHRPLWPHRWPAAETHG
jgi:hypothetical protein